MSAHLITTTATIRTCRCGQLILTGIAEGLTARVDLTPITNEPDTIRAGRWTYSLIAGQLHHRDDFAQAAPARGPILAEHACPAPRYRQDTLL